MATVKNIKEFDGENGFRVFASTVGMRKTRVSIVKGENARNFREGELVFQKTYRSWNNVPQKDIETIAAIIGS